MVDDMGWGDAGCYDQRQIRTPHIDRLAREGMGFTDVYAGGSVCAPSRCVLMRPQTLAYALHDSPLGLLACLTEKLWEWGGHGDDFWETFNRDSLLTNVTLYWLTGCILPSMRYHSENRPLRIDQTGEPLRMPAGILLPLRDPWSKPRSLAETRKEPP